MRTTMGLPRWVVISTAATMVAVPVIALAVLLHAGKQGSNPFSDVDELMTKGEVRRILGPPDTVEVQEGPIRPLPIGPPLALVKAECWSYGSQDEIREAKLCFGQNGRLTRFAWSSNGLTLSLYNPREGMLPVCFDCWNEVTSDCGRSARAGRDRTLPLVAALVGAVSAR